MRLTKELAKKATKKLLTILAENPEGMGTAELRATLKFNGDGSLSGSQISRLLRASRKVTERGGAMGRPTYLFWTIRKGK